jgi:hypothetical protein
MPLEILRQFLRLKEAKEVQGLLRGVPLLVAAAAAARLVQVVMLLEVRVFQQLFAETVGMELHLLLAEAA